MPAYPDRDTLRLRAPDRRTPAQAAALARRELARRPAATLADVSLAAADRALVGFQERYPGVAERFHAGVLWSCAHGHAQPAGKPTRRPCGWCLARAWSRRYGGPAPRVDQLGRLLVGDPCPNCQAALSSRPPATRPRSAARSTKPAARSSTSTTSRTSTARAATGRSAPAMVAAATRASLTAAAAGQLSPELAAENAEALRRMGIDPAGWPHLTRARP
jgi:hypothetical protein